MNRNKLLIYFFVLIFFAISYSQDEKKLRSEFNTLRDSIKAQLTPDRSLAVFDIHLSKLEEGWILEGESTSAEAHRAVREMLNSLLAKHGVDKYLDKVQLMPDAFLGGSTYGIINASTAHLRRQPSGKSELIDQVIMGDVIRLLKRKGNWFLIQTHYGYLGWMESFSFVRTNKEGADNWNRAKRIQVTSLITFIYAKADASSQSVADVVLNGTLRILDKGEKWTLVAAPDSREGYISNSDCKPFPDQPAEEQAEVKEIIETAKKMMGIPYLWGGNTSMGNDCSGFAQNTFRANGIQLSRDARQQVLFGKTIIPAEDFSNVKPADLLFFGKNDNITHMGISLGGFEFIHQGSYVKIDSFNEKAENFNAYRKKTLKVIKRIINN